MTLLLTYQGYVLTERSSGGYRSVIDGRPFYFDSTAQFMQYINLITKGYAEKQ